MSNHDELVAEMAVAEKMPMIERLKLAKKRRAQQLKTYAQYEKELNKNAGSGGTGKGKSSKKASTTRPKGTGRLQFTGSILLLDAAARNDVAEGTLFRLIACLFAYFFVPLASELFWYNTEDKFDWFDSTSLIH